MIPSWPASRLGEAVEALARAAGLPLNGAQTPKAPASLNGLAGRWIDAVAGTLGLEADPVRLRYGDAEARLRSLAPALVRMPDGRFVALVDGKRLLAPDGSVHRLGAFAVREALCRELDRFGDIDALLQGAEVPQRKRERVRRAVLKERFASQPVGECWTLRLSPGAGFWQQLRLAGVRSSSVALVAAHTAQYIIWIAAWWTVGLAALQGRLEPGWLAAWVLLLATLIPLRVGITWLQGRVAIPAGGILKERLLFGALRLDPDQIRTQGAGQLLGRVIESEALESMALGGGFLAVVATIELSLAAMVIGTGAGGWMHAGLLVGWAVAVLVMARRYFRHMQTWTAERRDMTHDLVERMVGHRTRLAQESRKSWHEAEDQTLERYQRVCMAMDRNGVWLKAAAPRGWLALGVLGIAPAFVMGTGTPAALAVGLGGVLLAFRAFRRLSAGLHGLIGAWIAWTQVKPLFDAASQPEPAGSAAALAMSTSQGQALIEAHDISFSYNGAEPVLQGCNLRISDGDRLLLQGASGGGKSTFASLLTGVRAPRSGLLLAGGLDRRTLGPDGWLERIAAAPQFHENHVLTGPFAFNLLMGRRGLVGEEDLAEAEELCYELGLGELLERMPAGMLQVVGDTGWQLSHGERSRVFIARALLQRSDVIVLDESFAALDPDNLRRAIDCVNARARALLVIAHP